MPENDKKKLESLVNAIEKAIPKMPNSAYYSILGRAEAIYEMGQEQEKQKEEEKKCTGAMV